MSDGPILLIGPKGQVGSEALPLKEARKLLTRALDLLVMGVGGIKVDGFPSKLSVRAELLWTVQRGVSRGVARWDRVIAGEN